MSYEIEMIIGFIITYAILMLHDRIKQHFKTIEERKRWIEWCKHVEDDNKIKHEQFKQALDKAQGTDYFYIGSEFLPVLSSDGVNINE